MKKEKKWHITTFILIVMIGVSTIFIGTPLAEQNAQMIYIISSIFSIVYFTSKIIKKEKMEFHKIDVAIIVLAFSTMIPFLFKSYVSLTETIHSIIRYMSILGLYLISRQESEKHPQFKNVIIHTILFSILLLCMIGLDEIHLNLLKDFKFWAGYSQVVSDEIRIGSLFSYPNTMAIVAGLGIFLCMGMLLDSKHIKLKILYGISIIIMLITFILTYSRLAYILFFICFILYAILLAKKYKIKDKFNKKIYILFGIVGLCLILYIIIGLQIPGKIEVKEHYQKILYQAVKDAEYQFSFDIEVTGEEDDVKIIFIEKNGFFDDIKTTEISVGNYVGKKEIFLYTQENTAVIYLKIQVEQGAEITIHKAYLNGETFILKYKLLPTGIVEKVKSIQLHNKSAWERLVFIEDALSLIKQNWLFGMGGNAWRTSQLQIQQYNYYANEVHCFPIQVFLEYGIIAFLSCLGIGIYLLIRFWKEIKKQNLDIKEISLLMGILLVLTHSILDFDMSFFYVMLIVFLLISILKIEKSNDVKEGKTIISILLHLSMIIISVCSLYIVTIEKRYYEDTRGLVIDSSRTEQQVWERYYQLLPFNKEIKEKLYQSLEKEENKEKQKKILKELMAEEKYDTNNITLENLKKYVQKVENKSALQEEIESILEIIKCTENFGKYKPSLQIIRWNNLRQIIYIVDDTERNLEAQLQKEIKEKRDAILDAEKCRYSKEYIEEYKQEIERIEKNENISFDVSV